MGLALQFVRGKLALPLVVFAIGVMLSLGLGYSAHREIARSAKARFDTEARDAARSAEERFDAYTEVLIGLRALFHTSETVTRSQFRDYVAGLDLQTKFPGFQVLNFAAYVPAADKQAFEERMRRGGLTDFAISPPGERPAYFPQLLIEPLAGLEKLVGADLGAMPRTLQALHAARDSGDLTSSGRLIKIKGSSSELGLAARLPVYRVGMPQDTVEQRRAAYIGSVGAGFHVANMLRDITKHNATKGLRLRLLDGGLWKDQVRADATPGAAGITEMTVLFDSGALPAPAAASASSAPLRRAGQTFELQQTFRFGSRVWIVEVSKDAGGVISGLDRAIPWLVLLGGLAISALLAGIIYSLATSRGRALAIAKVMTRDLRTSERQLEEAQHLASLGSWILDVDTDLLHCSDEAVHILGFDAGASRHTLAELLSRVPTEERATVEGHITAAQQSRHRVEFEHRLRLPDGTERWVHVIMQLVEDSGANTLRGTVRDDTQRRKGAQRLELEHEVARLLVSDGEPEFVISRALEAVGTHLRWDCGAVWGLQEDGLAHCSSAWRTGNDPALDQFVRISRSLSYRRDEGSLGQAFGSGDAVCVDTSGVKRDFTRDALAAQAGLRVGLIVPAVAADQITALELLSREPRSVDAETLESLRAIALQLAQYEQRKQSERALRYIANHDALTGLSNRTSLQRDLARAIKRSNRYQKRLAVMFVDLDRFKHINDTLGHGVGDAMIKACAERLGSVLREDDAVARFGGDEFVLMLENLSEGSDAAVVADKVLARCAEPFIIDGRELHVTASVGVSIYPEDGADGETLLKNADTAMYRAKDKGRNNYQFYAAQMNAQGTERLMLETGLRRALERGELELHYQPKMDLRTQRIVGVEALMRWHHPVLGMVSPVQFIPIAEETGLIEAMGRWALERACADARSWQERGLPPVQMSVNLSPRQLTSPTLLTDIASILRSSRLDPALLELEITESAMMKNPEQAAMLLQQIRDLGVGLAIDDFGTGYSSLSYLKRFPLSTVKVDRSFVNDLSQDADAQALTDGIITLAHGLRMKVVAEGVETAAQLAHLRAHGCDEIQGYWLCKPVPADDVCKFMARHLRNQFASPVAA